MKKETKSTKQQKETQKPVFKVLTITEMSVCTGGGFILTE